MKLKTLKDLALKTEIPMWDDGACEQRGRIKQEAIKRVKACKVCELTSNGKCRVCEREIWFNNLTEEDLE
ncbi:MAG: hypothetical protein ACUZ8N_10840 [Candidatus Scalindua sp.]